MGRNGRKQRTIVMTELNWEGKYRDGKKVAPVRIALPFQTVETVNESAQERQKSLDLFSTGRDSEWRNRLIWGDKKYVLPSLLSEFAGKVNLIYIDPPFDTGADFSFTATIPDHPETDEDETSEFVKQPSMIEQKAYRDTWGQGANSYVQWFYETAVFLHEILAESGNLFVHCDVRVNSFARLILNEVFGADCFRNEIVWQRTSAGKPAFNNLPRNADYIIWYAKSANSVFNPLMQDLSEEDIKSFNLDDHEGRGKYNTQPIINPADRPNLKYVYTDSKGRKWQPPSKGWRFNEERMRELEQDGRLHFTGSSIREKYYLSERLQKGKQMPNIWTDISGNSVKQSSENQNYPTQKPEMLLERIIKMSSNEGDLVLDCFIGSGTTAVVAEKLGRRWISCDLGRFAIQTTRKRLLTIPDVKPFVVQNLGKYERQAWQSAEFTTPEDQREKELKYRRFILDLYKAEPVTGYLWLHGVKNGRMIHVGSVDAPVTLADVKSIAAEVWRSVGKGKESPEKAAADILGWDFALEVNEVAKQVAAESKIDVAFKVIPREVLDKKAVEQGDIRFFELASLSVDIEKQGMEVTVKLTDFVIPPQDVPADVQKAITHWSQWIDYWAIDWDYKNDTFHNQWQSYRTRKNPKIELEASHTYQSLGEYQVVVKVIDILGNDTTKLVKVKVGSAPIKKQKAEAASRR